MKNYLICLVGFLVFCAACFDIAKGQSPKNLTTLTQLSSREWIDLSKVSYVELPVYTTTPGCADCNNRWGAFIVVDGVHIDYTEEAEVEVRRLLNVK